MPTTLQETDAPPDLGELLGGDGDDVESAAMAERIGAALLAMAQIPGTGQELAGTALESLEKAGGASAAAVLAAIAVFAGAPLAGEAGAALERLHRAGVRSAAEDAVGTAQVAEARRLRLDDGEILVAILHRAATREVQAAIVIVEDEEAGGAVVDGRLSPPAPRRSLGTALRKLDGALEARGTSISPVDLTEALRSAFARSAEVGRSASFELAVTAPILSRALTGDPTAFAPVVVRGSHQLPVDPEDDEEFEAASEELAEHLFDVNEGDPVVERAGPFVAATMLNYKWHCGDGRLGSWTTADLDGYLLDYFPRKVSARDQTVRDTPGCVVAFLTMLDDHGALEGPPLEVLAAYVKTATKEFRHAAADRRRWGPAKSTVMAMLADGVDPGDEEAASAWIDAFNVATRLSLAGPVPWAEAGAHGQVGVGRSPGGGRTTSAARAKQRKAQRAARRRNRH